MKKFIYGFMLLAFFAFTFSSCEKEECETCTLNLAWADPLYQAAFDLEAVSNGYADAQAEAEADLEAEGVSFGEVCGDAIQTSEDNYDEFMDGVTGFTIDGMVICTFSYTCQ